jgi:hypothetical protein
MPILGIVASSNYQRVAPDTGAMFPLGMVSVGSAGASSIDFTSIPSTYKHLQIRAMASTSSSTASYFRFNSDTGSNYARHMLQGNGSSAAAYAGSSQTSMWFVSDINVSPYVAGAVVDILDYASTSKNKTIRSLSGVDNNNTSGNNAIIFASGLWMNTNAISSISIFPLSGNFQQYSSFALYGIKGA